MGRECGAGSIRWRDADMDHFARAGDFNCLNELLVEGSVVGELVFRDVNDDYADGKPGKVLLKLEAAIESDEDIKFILSQGQKGPVVQGVPALRVDRGDLVITEERRDARIYALVNEDAHSRSWWLAKSSTASTCSRVMGG